MKIMVDKEICVGAGRCADLAPSRFAVSDADGLVVLLEPHSDVHAHDHDAAAVTRAVAACPSMAIRLDADDAASGS